VTLNDSGWYTCIVSNRYGGGYRSAWLSVQLHETTTSRLTNNSQLVKPIVIVTVVFVFVIMVLCGIAAGIYFRINHRWKGPGHRTEMKKFMSNELYLPANIPVDAKWEFNRQK